jgi:hypothetical protein
MGARFRDRQDDALALHLLAVLQLGLESSEAARGHRNLFHRLIPIFESSEPPAAFLAACVLLPIVCRTAPARRFQAARTK